MNTSKIFSPNPSRIEKFSTQFSSFGNDYVFSRVSKTENFSEFTSESMRMGGMIIVLCLSGTFQLDVNLETQTLQANDLIITGPDSE